MEKFKLFIAIIVLFSLGIIFGWSSRGICDKSNISKYEVLIECNNYTSSFELDNIDSELIFNYLENYDCPNISVMYDNKIIYQKIRK